MKFYKAKDEKEYDGIMTILSAMGINLDNNDITWNPRFSLITISESSGIIDQYDEMREEDELIPLSEFIALVEKYKSQIKIGNHMVVFNKGSIKVGCTTVSNDTVRDIAKNLVD